MKFGLAGAWLSAASYHLGTTLQRHNTENFKQTFPEKELRGLFPHSCACERFTLYTIGLTILLQENMGTDPGNI